MPQLNAYRLDRIRNIKIESTKSNQILSNFSKLDIDKLYEKNIKNSWTALFSTYEKTGHFIKDGLYELEVLYYVFDEMRIIQKALMLGPNIEILGNDEIKSKILERQKQMLESGNVILLDSCS